MDRAEQPQDREPTLTEKVEELRVLLQRQSLELRDLRVRTQTLRNWLHTVIPEFRFEDEMEKPTTVEAPRVAR